MKGFSIKGEFENHGGCYRKVADKSLTLFRPPNSIIVQKFCQAGVALAE